MAAEGRRADERALVVVLLVLRQVARHAELVVPDVQDVALVEGGVRDRLAVQERAVAAAEVADPQREAVGVDLGVDLRDVGRGQDELEPGRAADPEGQGLERRPLQRAVVSRPGSPAPTSPAAPAAARASSSRARSSAVSGAAEAAACRARPKGGIVDRSGAHPILARRESVQVPGRRRRR